jgi:ubiquitin-protein ligase
MSEKEDKIILEAATKAKICLDKIGCEWPNWNPVPSVEEIAKGIKEYLRFAETGGSVIADRLMVTQTGPAEDKDYVISIIVGWVK